MSRLSSRRITSRVQLELRRDGVHATLLAGWLRRRRLAGAAREWEDAAPDLAARVAPAAAGAIGEIAAGHALRGAALQVEIANAFVHYDVAEGVFSGHSEAQLGAVAQACVREVLGEGEPNEVRWQLQADERHLLLCAIPTPLLQALRGAAQAHELVLRQLQPAFAPGWNRHRHALRSGLGVIACSDGEHALVAFVRDGIVEAMSAGTRPDDLEDPQAAAPGVDRLLNGLGLMQAATPTRLDAQVNRLVASLGVDIASVKHFVALPGGSDDAALSSRWMVYREPEAAT